VSRRSSLLLERNEMPPQDPAVVVLAQTIVAELSGRVETLNTELGRIQSRLHDSPCAAVQELRDQLRALKESVAKEADIQGKKQWAILMLFLKWSLGLVTIYAAYKLGGQ